jgi:hypothetical protein
MKSKFNMRTIFYQLSLLCLLLFFVFGCSDEPTNIGENIIPTSDAPQTDSILTKATSSQTFLHSISANAGILFLGEYGDIKAKTLLQFSNLTSIPSNVTIDSAKLTMSINYRFKDSSGTIGIEVHQMLSSWNYTSFLWDSLTPGSYNSTIEASSLKLIQAQDSIFSIPLNNLVRSWYNGNTANGIVLIPNSISNSIILGFNNPTILVSFHDTSDTSQSTTISASQQTSIANSHFQQQAGLMYLQSGVAYRSLVRFDSLSIPPRVAIAKAILEIPIDTNSSLLNNYSSTAIRAYLLLNNSAPYNDLTFGTPCTIDYLGRQKIFKADIKTIIQRWVTLDPNNGIVLFSPNEYISLDRFALHGATANDSLRPRIKIFYSKFP